MSAAALVARQIPIREGERITGFIDLALERAYHYRPGAPSERNDLPSDLALREAADRFHMLEQLADHDVATLEHILEDKAPRQQPVLAAFASEKVSNLVVPGLSGSGKRVAEGRGGGKGFVRS